MNLSQLESEIFSLPIQDRALLAKRLLLSLEEISESEFDNLWSDVSAHRAAEFDAGRVQAIPGEEVAKLVIIIILLLAGLIFWQPVQAVIMDNVPRVQKHKSKLKHPKMTEITEECIVDKSTDREFCQVVDVSAAVSESASNKNTQRELENGHIKTQNETKEAEIKAPNDRNSSLNETKNSEQAADHQENLNGRSVPANMKNELHVALVIGNSAYTNSPLKNPINDALDMSIKLRSLGFNVVERNDIKTKQIGGALREFRSKLSPGAVALVFYAGHGIQIKGENYFPAVDAEINSEEDVQTQSIALKQIMDVMEESKTRLNLVFLDACRNNPYARSFRSAESGLAKVTTPSGTLISYATRPGSVARDGEGRNGLYTSKLLRQMGSGQQIELALKAVVSEVKAASSGTQEPWMEGSIEGDFCFVGCGAITPPVREETITSMLDPAAMELSFWDSIKNSNNQDDFNEYLKQYPSGRFSGLAHNRLKQPAPVTVRPELTPVPVAEQSYKSVFSIGSTGPGGGIVFSIDNLGLHGLEAKAADEANQLNWTAAIASASADGSGWHLPTKEELDLLYQQRVVVGAFANLDYWSSTENDKSTAWYHDFGDDNLGELKNKADALRVRAVRSF